MKNRVITISREFGSGGRTIGKKVAEKLGIPCYDAEIIQEMAKETGFAPDYVKEAGEYAPGSFLSAAFSNRMFGPTNEDILWEHQYKVITELAEKMPAAYHGVGKFDPARGTSSVHQPCFSDVFGQTLTELALENPRICAITAAMRDGTGLKTFSEVCPDRFFDVGIAEEHALSMACGMAKQGLIPAVAIYSTFLQRAFDMLLHDLALLQLHVVLGVDRAGLVGEDGRTHHGMFDVGYLRQVPGLKIYCPASFQELRVMLRESVLADTCPVAVRSPRGGEGAYRENAEETRLKEGTSCTVITYGTMINAVLEAAEAAEKDGLSAEILKLRTIAPIDWAAIEASCRKTGRVLVVEETSDRGCVANDIFSHLAQANISCVCAKQNLGASFIGHGAMQDLYELTGLNANALLGRIREVCHEA